MKWTEWRRSENVEDYRDPNKPVPPDDPTDLTSFYESINEMIKITNSTLADDAGGEDIEKDKN